MGALAFSHGGLRPAAAGGEPLPRLDAVPDRGKALRCKVFLAAARARGVGHDRDALELGHAAHSTAGSRAVSFARRSGVPTSDHSPRCTSPRTRRAAMARLSSGKQRKASRSAAAEELRAIDADVRVGQALAVTVDDDVALQAEVPARVVRGVGDQHQVRVRVGLELQRERSRCRSRYRR